MSDNSRQKHTTSDRAGGFTLKGIDLGFGWTKGVSDTREFAFPSVTGSPRNLFSNEVAEGSSIQNLIHVGEQNKEVFVGDLAIRQSPFKHFSLINKTENPNSMLLFQTMLAILCNSYHERTTIVTGLPITQYFEQKDSLELLIAKRHEINLKICGKPISHIIDIENLKIVAQPYGTAMNWLLDSEGNIQPNLKPVAVNTIGIVDIGFLTTDLLYLEGMEINQDFSTSLKSGLHKAYKAISDSLGIESPLYQLDKDIISGLYQEVKSYAYKSLAQQIKSEIETYWLRLPSIILITGGGGFTLNDHLQLPNSTLIQDGVFGNVRGYFKLGRRLFR